MASYSFFFVFLGFACLGQTSSSSLTDCYNEHIPDGRMTCQNVRGYGHCLTTINAGNDVSLLAQVDNQLAQIDALAESCEAREKFDHCRDRHITGQSIDCTTAPGYVSCLQALSVNDVQVSNQIDDEVKRLGSFARKCSANNRLNECRRIHAPENTITCDTVGGYLYCLKAVDVSEFPDVQASKDGMINNNEDFQANTCQGIIANAAEQKKLDDCASAHIPSGTITCRTVSAYLACLEQADVSSSEVVQGRKQKSLDAYRPFEKECKASAKLNKCMDDNEEDGYITCETVDSYLECLRSVDVSAYSSLEARKTSSLDRFETQSRKCKASATLQNCMNIYVPTGNLTCEIAENYYNCLNDLDVSEFVDVQSRKDQNLAQAMNQINYCRDVAAFQGCKDQHLVEGQVNCQGVHGYIQCLQELSVNDLGVRDQISQDMGHLGLFAYKCLAQDKLNQCMKAHAPDNTLTCDTIGGYLDCIKAADVSDVPTVEAQKNNIINQKEQFQAKCQGQSENAAEQKKLDDCASAHIPAGTINCDIVPAYLNCLRQADVSSSATVQNTKMGLLAGYEPFQDECEGTAALNKCIEDNAVNGQITCSAVDAYLECLRNADAKGIPAVEQRKSSSVAKFEGFSGKCKANEKLNKCSRDHAVENIITCSTVGGYLDCIKAADVSGYPTVQDRKEASIRGKEEFQSQCTGKPPAPKTKKECIQKHAPRRVLNCKNSVALQDCILAINGRVPLAVSRKVALCEANKPVFVCVHRWTPRWAMNCQSGASLISCLQNLVLGADQAGPAAKRDRLIAQARALLQKTCPQD